MYVCICNAFTDKQVRRCLEKGACSTSGVFKSMGCAPQCGTCVPHVRGMVRDHIRTTQEAAGAMVPAVAADGFMLAAE